MDFDEYVAARGPELLRLARLLCGDAHHGEDLVQTALAKAYGRWTRISSVDHPDAYVRRMIVNAHLDWRRRLSTSETPTEHVEVPVTGPDPAVGVSQRDELRQILATLPKKQRTVLVLRYYAGLPDEEIAELMDSRAGSVRVWASRGLATLRSGWVPSPDGSLMKVGS